MLPRLHMARAHLQVRLAFGGNCFLAVIDGVGVWWGGAGCGYVLRLELSQEEWSTEVANHAFCLHSALSKVTLADVMRTDYHA